MPDDAISDRQRAAEDEYFRKKDLELIERMRAAAAADQARRDLGARVGITDPALLEELEALGFTTETVALLPLIPVVQTAWAEGGVSTAERTLIVDLARARGLEAGSAADRKLSDWLARQPPPDVFARATRLIRAMLEAGGASGDLTADGLIRYCESIAAASGGIFGLRSIS